MSTEDTDLGELSSGLHDARRVALAESFELLLELPLRRVQLTPVPG